MQQQNSNRPDVYVPSQFQLQQQSQQQQAPLQPYVATSATTTANYRPLPTIAQQNIQQSQPAACAYVPLRPQPAPQSQQQQQQQAQQQPLSVTNPPTPPSNPAYTVSAPQQPYAVVVTAPPAQAYNAKPAANSVVAATAAPTTTTTATDPALYDALAETERLVIRQKIEYVEAAAQIAANAANLDALGAFGEQANRYDVFDGSGKKFRVVETSEYLCRCCLRPNHALKLHVYNTQQSKVMVFDRPWKFGYCCSLTDCCRQEMKVYQGDVEPDVEPDPSKMIGYIRQPFLGGMFAPKVNVMDREGGQEIATVQAEAKCCIGGMCCNHTFWVKDSQGKYMGKIVKERPKNLSQVGKELATDADNFTLYVPKDMDVRKKANMLAALHLIDYMLFEDEGDLNVDVRNQRCSYKCCDVYCCGCVLPCKLSCRRCGRRDDKVQDSQQAYHQHVNGYQQAQSNGYTGSPQTSNNNSNNSSSSNNSSLYQGNHNHGYHRHEHHHHHHHGPGRGHHGPGRGPGRGHHKHHLPHHHHDHHHHHHNGHHP